MTIGEKIKIARSLRGITQKQLGFLVGLPDVRIRQYETNARTPKADKLNDIASALGVSCTFFTNHNIDSYDDILHVFFELEQTSNARVEKIERNGKPAEYAIVFDNVAINQRLEKWYEKRESTTDSKGNEYMLWKTNFPNSLCDK